MIDWTKTDPDERYANYHLASAFDRPDNRGLFAGLYAEDIFIFTAMPERYRKLRELWFNHNRLPFRKMLMRGANDHRSSVDLKRSMLHDLYASGIRRECIETAYDDRPDVVEMYKSEGVNGVLVSIHNVCAYTAPKLEVA